MPSPDPELRHLAASIAANTRLARSGPDERRQFTAAARAALHKADLDAVDPNRELPEEERELRARAHRKVRMARVTAAARRAAAQRRLDADLAASRAVPDPDLCGHVWPAEITIDGICNRCGLVYGQYSTAGGAA
jgi:hypothetical protein